LANKPIQHQDSPIEEQLLRGLLVHILFSLFLFPLFGSRCLSVAKVCSSQEKQEGELVGETFNFIDLQVVITAPQPGV